MRKYSLSSTRKIFSVFIGWKLWIIVFSLLGVSYVPLAGRNFFGGGIEKYSELPLLYGLANFDGEHYLSIAQFGYRYLEQQFFPFYPVLIRLLSLNESFFSLTITGILISNLSFLIALYFLYLLLKEDYKENVAFWTILLLAVFPTSFYFGAVYNESLYLLLSVLTFYFAKKQKWFLVSIAGFLACLTRVFGVFLFFALLLEIWQNKTSIRRSFWIFIIPLGLIIYMIYQGVYFNDPLAFYNNQLIVGEQHQRGIITLPQVFFRYVKILYSLAIDSPLFSTIVLEFFIGIIFTVLHIYGYFRGIKASYLFYSLAAFVTPTIQGSFSSVPRYVLILFPAFLALSLFVSKRGKLFKFMIMVILSILLGFETILFIRGYWVA